MRRAKLENRKVWEYVRTRGGALVITVEDYLVG